MDIDLNRLIDDASPLKPLESPLVVYGAGNTGKAVAAHLTAAGYRIAGFLDANARSGQHCDGIFVARPHDWLQANQADRFSALAAIHNYETDMVSVLSELRGFGFLRVVNIVEYQNLFPEDRTFRYWLAPRQYYKPFKRDIACLLDAVADEVSRHWVRAAIAFRLTGNYGLLPTPSPTDQYQPADLPRWRDPIRYIDCGAYKGDTIEQLASRGGYRFEAIAAFEPDLANFAALAPLAGHFGPAICLPCGVADSTSLVRFHSGQGMASRGSPSGENTIQCVAIDEVLPRFAPTLIKLDIEGAELQALAGAHQTIRHSRPALAVSLYHNPAHLWQIPLLIREWDLGYQLFIRGHGHSTFDLVLYAVPYATGSPSGDR